ncbi:adh_short domain-containing protein, partial [Cephalotus follicularis]
ILPQLLKKEMADSTRSPCMKKKLEGKVGIITGGASGIGEATALHFATYGVRAIVIADIQDEKGEKLAASIGPGLCKYVRCDVSKEDQIKSLVQATNQLYGQLDVMFCNTVIMSKSEQKILDLDLDMLSLAKIFCISTKSSQLSRLDSRLDWMSSQLPRMGSQLKCRVLSCY